MTVEQFEEALRGTQQDSEETPSDEFVTLDEARYMNELPPAAFEQALDFLHRRGR
jgi:hypothetical protein